MNDKPSLHNLLIHDDWEPLSPTKLLMDAEMAKAAEDARNFGCGAMVIDHTGIKHVPQEKVRRAVMPDPDIEAIKEGFIRVAAPLDYEEDNK